MTVVAHPLVVDVVIVGGGPAGLQAALVLGRARRRVVVVDSEQPSHFVAGAVHGVLGFEGVPPRVLRERAWCELAPLDVVHVRGSAVRARSGEHGGFEVDLADGGRIYASRVVLAGGVHYAPSVDVPGMSELWGELVFHCPFCHGWEVRGSRIGAFGGSPLQIEHASELLRLWTDDVVSIAGVVSHLETDAGGALLVHHDQGFDVVDALLCLPVFKAVDDLPEQLGLTRVALEPMVPDPLLIEVDDFGATDVSGVFVAGDLAAGMPSASLALASGARAAFGVVRSLVPAP